jgi:hypothetical protein
MRTPYDGILKKNGDYYITFCHGDTKGFINLGIKNSMIKITPSTIRKNIKKYLGIIIDNNEKIFITPCYPNCVKNRYKKSLHNHNIHLITDERGVTGCSFYNGKIVYISDKFNGISNDISLLVRNKYSEFSAIDDEIAENIFTGKITEQKI